MEGGELFSRIQEKQNFNEQGEHIIINTDIVCMSLYLHTNAIIKLDKRKSHE